MFSTKNGDVPRFDTWRERIKICVSKKKIMLSHIQVHAPYSLFTKLQAILCNSRMQMPSVQRLLVKKKLSQSTYMYRNDYFEEDLNTVYAL